MLLVIGQRSDEHFTRAFDSLGWKEGVEYVFMDRYASPKLSVNPVSKPEFLDEIELVWPRVKPPFSKDAFKPKGPHQENYFHTEWNTFDDYLALFFEPNALIQPIGGAGMYHNKIAQLRTAERIGFSVPPTLISTDAKEVADFFEGHKKVVFKPLTSTSPGPEGALLTTEIETRRLLELEAQVSRCPGIYQRLIQKTAEWRVTIFGENIFVAEMRADDNEHVDWRIKYWVKGAVTAKKIPKHIERLCLAFLSEFALQHGIFDLVVSDTGEVYFLEFNPSGQYTFIEDHTGQRMSAAMAQLISDRRAST